MEHSLACFLPRIAPIFIINCPDLAPILTTFQLPRFPFGLTKDSDSHYAICITYIITSHDAVLTGLHLQIIL